MEIVISRECLIDEEKIPAFGKKCFLMYKGQDHGYIYGYEEGRLSYCLPYILKKKYFFSLLEFQSSTIICDSDAAKDEQKFLDLAVDVIWSELDVDFICQNPAYAIFVQKPIHSEWVEFGTYVVDLQQDVETLWKKIHSKHRNVIRRAEKNNISISFSMSHAEKVYELIKETQERSKHSFLAYEDYCNLIEALPNNIMVVTAFDGDEMQGCAIIVLDQRGAYYLYGGSVENPSLGAINHMHWELMKYLKDKGVKEYDFVGARLSDDISDKLQGIQRFKRRFGGELRRGYLWKAINKNWKYRLYKIVTKIRNRTKFVDAIDEENSRG